MLPRVEEGQERKMGLNVWNESEKERENKYNLGRFREKSENPPCPATLKKS